MFTVKNSSKIENKNLSVNNPSTLEKKEQIEEAVKPRKIIFSQDESQEDIFKRLATTKASFSSVLVTGRETVNFLDSKRNFDSMFEDWSPERNKVIEDPSQQKSSSEKETLKVKRNAENLHMGSIVEETFNENEGNKENLRNINNRIKGNNRYSNLQASKEKLNSGNRNSYGKKSGTPGLSSHKSNKGKVPHSEVEVKSFDTSAVYKESIKKLNQNKVILFPNKSKKNGSEKTLAEKRM